jgi:hypothetical protein
MLEKQENMKHIKYISGRGQVNPEYFW